MIGPAGETGRKGVPIMLLRIQYAKCPATTVEITNGVTSNGMKIRRDSQKRKSARAEG